MLNRQALFHLKDWIKKPNRKPLILRGARQVGKSTLVELFAKETQLKLVKLNLEKHLALNAIFQKLDIPQIIKELEVISRQKIHSEDTLLFLDEIQSTPYAIAALRYFYEEMPNLPVIAAGSLLDFALSQHSFSMPVGRIEYLHLGPLSFREFVATITPHLSDYLLACTEETIPRSAHEQLLQCLREYYFVGGMPEAVHLYQQTNSILEVQDVQRSLIETYQDDFGKYARQTEFLRLQTIFQKVPLLIGQKVKYVHYSREDQSKVIKSAIDLLCKAQVCHKVQASHCDGVPLGASVSERDYKLLFVDVGLVTFLCGYRWQESAPIAQFVNEGILAEQFIGQHLLFRNHNKPTLYYWLREGKQNNAEVDYVIEEGSAPLPIEVKSGASGTLKSLHQFVVAGKSNKGLRFDTNPPSIQHLQFQVPQNDQLYSFHLENLPLYAVESVS